jgi:hypothetical protein
MKQAVVQNKYEAIASWTVVPHENPRIFSIGADNDGPKSLVAIEIHEAMWAFHKTRRIARSKSVHNFVTARRRRPARIETKGKTAD